jgi:Cu2+-containing amine oxidase
MKFASRSRGIAMATGRRGASTAPAAIVVGAELGANRLWSTSSSDGSALGGSLRYGVVGRHGTASIVGCQGDKQNNKNESRRWMSSYSHPLDPLSAEEIQAASSTVKKYLGVSPDNMVQTLRFVAVSLLEPPKKEYLLAQSSQSLVTPSLARRAEIIALNPTTGVASEYHVELNNSSSGSGEDAKVIYEVDLPLGTQPLLTPEDCDLAEGTRSVVSSLCKMKPTPVLQTLD